MFRRISKGIILILVFTVIIIYLCIKYENIHLLTENENIAQISSPFESAIMGESQAKKFINSLGRAIISGDAPSQSTREVMYQVHIKSKGGHEEKIISYGNRMLHWYDGECVGEYSVPLVTRLYLFFIYGSI